MPKRLGKWITYQGKQRRERLGPRGGKYILYNDNKIYEKQYRKISIRPRSSRGSGRKKTKRKSAPSTRAKSKSKSKSKLGVPTLHLRWKKHNTTTALKNYFNQEFKDDKERLMSNQGWYCLGTTEYIGYVGMVGEWKKLSGKKRYQHTKNTIRHRWLNEHDYHDKYWPKGRFADGNLQIKKKKACLSTVTVKAARNPSSDYFLPYLINRGKPQAELIDEVEDFIIFACSIHHNDSKKRKLYQKRGTKQWVGGKDNPTPTKFQRGKTMINTSNTGSLKSKGWTNGGKYKIKCSGSAPSQLLDLFQSGINVNKYVP